MFPFQTRRYQASLSAFLTRQRKNVYYQELCRSLMSEPRVLYPRQQKGLQAEELIEYSDYALQEIAEAEGIGKDVCINPNFSDPGWNVAGEPLDC